MSICLYHKSVCRATGIRGISRSARQYPGSAGRYPGRAGAVSGVCRGGTERKVLIPKKKYLDKQDEFGLIVFESNTDMTSLEVYEAYSKRWEKINSYAVTVSFVFFFMASAVMIAPRAIPAPPTRAYIPTVKIVPAVLAAVSSVWKYTYTLGASFAQS